MPYKAYSIIDFWRRWHMTLSRFLRDYLYIPLGGSRSGPVRRYGNLMITMLLGGLWHGGGWTFLFWGGLHGAFLVIERLGPGSVLARISTPTRRVYALLVVIGGWVLSVRRISRGRSAITRASSAETA